MKTWEIGFVQNCWGFMKWLLNLRDGFALCKEKWKCLILALNIAKLYEVVFIIIIINSYLISTNSGWLYESWFSIIEPILCKCFCILCCGRSLDGLDNAIEWGGNLIGLQMQAQSETEDCSLIFGKWLLHRSCLWSYLWLKLGILAEHGLVFFFIFKDMLYVFWSLLLHYCFVDLNKQ